MQWSKLKTRVKSLIAPTLRKRIDFHMTQYRAHHNDRGEVCTCEDAYDLWITVDKHEIFRASFLRHGSAVMSFDSNAGLRPYSRSIDRELVRDLLIQREIHDPWDVKNSLISYLNLNPVRALRSRDPIHRAFSIIDRRVGQRSLKGLSVSTEEHPLVRLFYALRMPDIRGRRSESNGGTRLGA